MMNRFRAFCFNMPRPYTTDVPLHIAKQLKYVGDARGGAVQRWGGAT